jgi:6-phosphogluconolactonase (cycloisomerase 2 family)
MLVMPALAGFTQPAAAAAKKSGMLYTLTNAAIGNEVVAYSQAANGQLTFQGSYATGGLGSGAGLGSQGSIITSQDKRWLFAVNAGSNQVSVFAIKS